MTRYITLCLTSAFVAALAVPLASRLARAFGFYAVPVSDRWHRRPVPLLGGFAIAAGLAAGLSLAAGFSEIRAVVLGSAVMFVVGAIDDARSMRPAAKLLGQMLAASIVLWLIPPFAITGVFLIDQLIAFTWIVGLTNAFNLIDNMDGLAGGVALIAAAAFFALLLPAGEGALLGALACFIGAVAAFLAFNLPPARIFMGDSGSFLIGSFLASITLLGLPAIDVRPLPAPLAPLLMLAVPMFDTTFVSVTRRYAGRSALVGGRDHTSHRLVWLGASERRAVLALYALTAMGGLVGVSLAHLEPGTTLPFVALYLITMIAVAVVLAHVEPPQGAVAVREPPLVSELTYGRRIYEILLDASLLSVAYYAAFRLRFQGPDFDVFFPPFAQSFPIVIAIQLAGLHIAGKYRQVWRGVGASELRTLIRGVGSGVAASMLLVLLVYRFERFSRGVFAIDALLAFFMLVGARALTTGIDEYLRRRRASGTVVLIFGAGRGGTLLAHELLQNRDLELSPAGFLDDDRRKQALRIEGLPVLGTSADLGKVAQETGAVQLLISIRDLPAERVSELASTAQRAGLRLRRMRFSIDDVRPLATLVRHER